jgi:hypothetical protein
VSLGNHLKGFPLNLNSITNFPYTSRTKISAVNPFIKIGSQTVWHTYLEFIRSYFWGSMSAEKRRKRVEMNNELLLILALDMREKALKTFSFATFSVALMASLALDENVNVDSLSSS